MGDLRERKRERTRRALVDSAAELFARQGYDGTTVAEIAARAEVGTRTFFSYFRSKDELLFADAAERVRTALTAIREREPDERPVAVLLRALDSVGGTGDVVGDTAALRLRLIRESPAVRGRALQLQQDAQREIARELQAAYPAELDAVTASALVGAYVGAIAAALDALLDAGPSEPPESSESLARRLRDAVDRALRPDLHPTGAGRDPSQVRRAEQPAEWSG